MNSRLRYSGRKETDAPEIVTGEVCTCGRVHGHASPFTELVRGQNLRFPQDGGVAVVLANEWAGLLEDLPEVGGLLVITRNSVAAIGSYESYPRLVYGEEGGHAFDPDGSLHLDFASWRAAYAREEQHSRGFCYSIEVVDELSRHLHKVCLTPDSDFRRFLDLVAEHQAVESLPFQRLQSLRPDSAREGFPSSTAAGSSFLRIAELLEEVRQRGMPVRVVVSNGGAWQSTEVQIDEIREMGEWLFCSGEQAGFHVLRSPVHPLAMRSVGSGPETHWQAGSVGAAPGHEFTIGPGTDVPLVEWNELLHSFLA